MLQMKREERQGRRDFDPSGRQSAFMHWCHHAWVTSFYSSMDEVGQSPSLRTETIVDGADRLERETHIYT